jgi:RecA-family ATPase
MNDNVIKLRQRDEDLPLAFTALAEVNPEPRKQWLIKDFLGSTEMSCKFGMPGSAKSVLAGDLAAHVATGKPWFGRQVLSGSVLYIACERPALVLRRFAAWKCHHGVEDAPLAIIRESVDLCTNLEGAEKIIG